MCKRHFWKNWITENDNLHHPSKRNYAVWQNKVPMAQLRELLGKSGFKNVRTYIGSGNVVIETERNANEIAQEVRELIKNHIGPDLTVVVRTTDELRKVIDKNPFQAGYDIARVFFVSFAVKPSAKKMDEIVNQDFKSSKFRYSDVAGYMYIPDDASRSKLNNNYLEKKLGVSATTRNFNTMSKLIEIASS